MKKIQIPIAQIVGGGICVSASDGQKVHDEIYKVVANRDCAAISFAGVTRMTTAFLNAAVGQLYGEFGEDDLKIYLAPPEDFESWHLSRLKMVVDRSKEYFRDPDRFDGIFDENIKD